MTTTIAQVRAANKNYFANQELFIGHEKHRVLHDKARNPWLVSLTNLGWFSACVWVLYPLGKDLEILACEDTCYRTIGEVKVRLKVGKDAAMAIFEGMEK
tara:strand:+ start:520 stop:819 length:300 start_codon:yes stop_codon:yes gene_type:complete